MSSEKINSENRGEINDQNAAKWESLYQDLEKNINDNFLDDQDFIENKLKRPIEYSKQDADHDLAIAKAKRDEELQSINDLKTELERISDRTEADYYDDSIKNIAGKTDLNSKTGQARTFGDFDNYPQESGDARKRRHDLAVISEYVPRLSDEDAAAYSKRVVELYEDFPRKADESLDEYQKRISEAGENNKIYQKITDHFVDSESDTGKWLQEELKNVDEWQDHGRIDAKKANSYRRELYDKAIDAQLKLNRQEALKQIAEKQSKEKISQDDIELENQKNADELYGIIQELEELDKDLNQNGEAELKMSIEKSQAATKEEELQKAIELENQKNADELYDVTQALMESEEELVDVEPKEYQPLVAINLDWTHDRHEIAHDLAEQSLKAEVAKSNVIKRLWKGALFKKHYETKYTQEFIDGKRTDEDGRTVDDIIKAESPAIMEQFVLGATQELHDIYQEIGKSGKNGEEFEKADEKTNALIKQTIIDYARRSLEPGEKISDLDRDFRDKTRQIMEEAGKEKRISEGFKQMNFLKTAKEAAKRYEEILKGYEDVAINAKSKAEQDKAMALVMAGFQVYNVKAINQINLKSHRENINKIVHWLDQNQEAPEAEADNVSEDLSPESAATAEIPSEPSTPEAPEDTSESEAPAVITNAPEALKDFARDYEQAIFDRRAIIGDDLAFDLLDNQHLTQEKQISWADSISKLSEAGKAALKEIINMRNSLPAEEKRLINFGHAFSAFLAENPNLLQ